jgi:hypothetical protein
VCDYCRCRSDPVIAVLSGEHERLAVLAFALARSLAAGNVAAGHSTFAELVALLGAHTGGEEAGLFAELLAAGELVEAVGARCVEHDEIGAAVAVAQLVASQPDRWASAARLVLELLADHMWREETDVFPAAALALSAITFGATR